MKLNKIMVMIFTFLLLLMPSVIKAEEPNYTITRYRYIDTDTSTTSQERVYFKLNGGLDNYAYCLNPVLDPPRENTVIRYVEIIDNKGLACTYLGAYEDLNLTKPILASSTPATDDNKKAAGIARALRLHLLYDNSTQLLADFPNLNSAYHSEYIYTGADKNKYATCNLVKKKDNSFELKEGDCNAPEELISITAPHNYFTLVGNYYVSAPITVALIDNYEISNYLITLPSNVPSGIIVTDNPESNEGLNLTEPQEATTLYIKVPKESATTSMNIEISVNAKKELTCTTKTVTLYKYRYINSNGPSAENENDNQEISSEDSPRGRGWQDMFIVRYTKTDNNTNTNDDDSLTFSIPKIYVDKKDITNVQSLADAQMNITCDNGYIKDFTTTLEATAIELGPMFGSTCNLSEVNAPVGYQKLSKPLTFAVSSTGVLTTVGTVDKHFVITNSTINVLNGEFPDTSLYTWIGTIVIGGGLIATGLVLVKKNVRKKK